MKVTIWTYNDNEYYVYEDVDSFFNHDGVYTIKYKSGYSLVPAVTVRNVKVEYGPAK